MLIFQVRLEIADSVFHVRAVGAVKRNLGALAAK